MFNDPNIKRIFSIAGVMVIVALASYSYATIKEISQRYGPTVISVEGEGEVLATPDIASFSFAVNAKEDDAATAQNSAADIMESITEYLASAGVEEKDIKTQYYNLNPRYEYSNTVCTEWGCPPREEPTIIGYQVSQSVVVKVRDIDSAGLIISEVGALGAQNVSSISFTIDDEDALREEARVNAIKDAREKAERLAEALGVRVVRMNGYWEDQGRYPTAYGIGGDMMESAAMNDGGVMTKEAVLPTGENTVTARVSVSYEVR